MTANIVQTNNTLLNIVDVDGVTVDIIENALGNAREENGRRTIPNRNEPGYSRAR